MTKILIRSVRTGVTKLVAPVFADILVKTKKYIRVDAEPEVIPAPVAEQPKPARRPRTPKPANDDATEEPRRRTYRRRDQTAEE